MTALRSPESNLRVSQAPKSHPAGTMAADKRSGIALALGGGFSRGFAHLGVLEVLEQEHIPISAIVGTSIGGLLGAAYADGISVGNFAILARQVRVRDFLRFQSRGTRTSPKKAIASASLFANGFRHAVEELSIPTAIVTTDFDTGAAYVFTRGPSKSPFARVARSQACSSPWNTKAAGLPMAASCPPCPPRWLRRMNAACVLGIAVGSNA